MARMLAAWRLANGTFGSLAQYWATLIVQLSPPVGTVTSKKCASAATFPSGRWADSAICQAPQRQAAGSLPCCAAIRSSARSSAREDWSAQLSGAHQDAAALGS